MIITIKPNARLDQGTFDKCALWEDSDEHRLIVDLTTLIFVDTYAMVALLTIVTLWRRDGDPVDLLLSEQG